MRIIFHHRTQLSDAQGIHIAAMARAFQELGHEVDVISAVGSWRGDAVQGRPLSPIQTHLLPRLLYEMLGLTYNLYGYRNLARAMGQRRYDLIYERYALNSVCGVVASRRFGVPLLLEVNGPWHDHSPFLKPLFLQRLARRLQRWVCSNSTHTIVVTAALKQLLVEEGVPERKLTVMHNAVDPLVFNPQVSGAEVRRRYRLNGGIVAGFVGWLRDWHGLADLVEAIHASQLMARGLRLLIVGAGPSFPQVERRVREFGLEDKIILTGPVPHEHVPAHIAALDIALQPRATEYACPLKLVEYMAMGRCILAPDQPNIRELLADGLSARLFPPGDYPSLVNLVSELMSAPARRASLGRNALRTVVERNLTWRANAARAIGLLRHRQNQDFEAQVANLEVADG